MRIVEALRNNQECLTAWAAVKSYARSKFPEYSIYTAYSIMFMADWFELQENRKTFTDTYWRGKDGLYCQPSYTTLIPLSKNHWSNIDVNQIPDEDISEFVASHSSLKELFQIIDNLDHGEWLSYLENFHVWNKARRTPLTIVDLRELASGQKIELIKEFSRSHLENSSKAMPPEGALLISLEHEKEKLKQEQLNNLEEKSKSYGIPFQIECGQNNTRAEKAWCSIQRYCNTRDVPDDNDLAYKLMFLADCRLLDATRALKHENAVAQTFTNGEWNFSSKRGVPQPLVFVAHLSTFSNAWDIKNISKFSDSELDEFEEEYSVLGELYSFVDSLSILEFESFLDDVPVWRSSSASIYRPTNLRFSALSRVNLVTLPSEISDLTKRVKVDEISLSFEEAAKVISFPVVGTLQNSGDNMVKRAGEQPYTP